MSTPTKPDAPRPPAHWRRAPWMSTCLLVLLPSLAIIAAAWGFGTWLVSTPTGLRTTVAIANAVMPSIQITGASGSLRDGFQLQQLQLAGARWKLNIDHLVVAPHQWSLVHRQVDLDRLTAARIDLSWTASSGPDTGMPSSIGLPLDLRLRQVSVGELRFGEQGHAPTVISDLQLTARADATAIVVESAAARWGTTQAQASGRINARQPFELNAAADVGSTLQGQQLNAELVAAGSLKALELEAHARSSATRADLSAQLAPFASVKLTRLQIKLSDWDPSLWFAQAPQMKLRGSADIQAEPNSNGFAVSGPLQIENLKVGPIDQKQLPLRSARGNFRWSAEGAEVDLSEVLAAHGRANGRVKWTPDGGLDVAAHFNDIDASTIQSNLRSTTLTGELSYSLNGEVQHIKGVAHNSSGLALAADFDLTLRNNVLSLAPSQLHLGKGSATAAGTIALTNDYATKFKADFQDLDLAQLAPALSTKLNGEINVDAVLKPSVHGNAQLNLRDSLVAGHAIHGEARLHGDADSLDLDARLAAGDSLLQLSGGLGNGKSVKAELDAPTLNQWIPGAHGAATVQAELSGTRERPQAHVQMKVSALSLASGERIESIDGTLNAELANDAAFELNIKLGALSSSRGEDFSLSAASLNAAGSLLKHHVTVDGMTASKQPLHARADGGWRDNAWRGALTADLSGPLKLKMPQPAPLVLATGQIDFGPADFSVQGARFMDVIFQHDSASTHTAGAFTELQPQALNAQTRATRRALRERVSSRQPLSLSGHWDLRASDELNGTVLIERSAGDLYAGAAALRPIGLSEARLTLDIAHNHVQGSGRIRGSGAGNLDTQFSAYVERASPWSWRLAPQRPIDLSLDAALTDLGWIGPLLTDDLSVGGEANAAIHVSGTPDAPNAAGTITAKNLMMAWIDQGVRLENGSMDAVLQDGVLVLNDLSFNGHPRVRPDEKRAEEGFDFKQPGTVKMMGRLALRSLTGAFSAKAEHLPILQREDRWIVASGDAAITLMPHSAAVSAQLQADGAYVDFGRDRLAGMPALPADVQVIRRASDRQAAPKAPLDLKLDLSASLGSHFYIRGAGLESRLTGKLDLKGEGGQLRALGTVNTVDGVYAGYGQRLQIQRGVVTFQGPLEDPALNVLAVRTGLPVEVGIAISGTAQRPQIKLYSDPSMPDVEKLNWLVLGLPPGGNGSENGNDRAMLAAAAGALLGGENDGPTSTLLRNLGVDQISLRTGNDASSLLPRESVAGTLRSTTNNTSSANNEVVAIGKRINEKLYLSYEQALTGASYALALTYQLTQRLSVVGRAAPPMRLIWCIHSRLIELKQTHCLSHAWPHK